MNISEVFNRVNTQLIEQGLKISFFNFTHDNAYQTESYAECMSNALKQVTQDAIMVKFVNKEDGNISYLEPNEVQFSLNKDVQKFNISVNVVDADGFCRSKTLKTEWFPYRSNFIVTYNEITKDEQRTIRTLIIDLGDFTLEFLAIFYKEESAEAYDIAIQNQHKVVEVSDGHCMLSVPSFTCFVKAITNVYSILIVKPLIECIADDSTTWKVSVLSDYKCIFHITDDGKKNMITLQFDKDAFGTVVYMSEIGGTTISDILSRDKQFRYQMLDRMRGDCDFYLAQEIKNSKYLWAQDVELHILYMKEIWDSFSPDEKPEWLSYEDIKEYEKLMCKD